MQTTKKAICEMVNRQSAGDSAEALIDAIKSRGKGPNQEKELKWLCDAIIKRHDTREKKNIMIMLAEKAIKQEDGELLVMAAKLAEGFYPPAKTKRGEKEKLIDIPQVITIRGACYQLVRPE